MLDQSIKLGTVLAFDFGASRIGVAVGEQALETAHPLVTIDDQSNDARFKCIAQLIQQWQPVALVVGFPTHQDGSDDEATHLCKRFGQRLHGRFRLPVFWVDERYSSVWAESLLEEALVFGKKRKQVLDQIAAQAILFAFYSSSRDEM